MADNNNNACGEVVASDTHYLRVLLTCKVDMDKIQIKIRRGSDNKQDAFLAEGVQVTAVTFSAFAKAPKVQMEHYGLHERQVRSDSCEDSEDSDIQLDCKVQMQLMRMRRPGPPKPPKYLRERRSESTVGELSLIHI